MSYLPFDISMGSVEVKTTNNRGFTPDEVSELCVNKLMIISSDAPPAIRDQAIDHKNRMRQVITAYMKQAIQSDRTTVYNSIKQAGYLELAEHIRKL